MIRINYFQQGPRHRLAVEGHAGYSDNGNDIVCAAVSSLSCSLLGFLEQSGAEIAEATAGSGSMTIDCTGDERIEAVFDMAMIGYLHISTQYPQHVDVYIASDGG